MWYVECYYLNVKVNIIPRIDDTAARRLARMNYIKQNPLSVIAFVLSLIALIMQLTR